MKGKDSWQGSSNVVSRPGTSRWPFVALVIGLMLIAVGVFLNAEQGSGLLDEAFSVLDEQTDEAVVYEDRTEELERDFFKQINAGHWSDALEIADGYVRDTPGDYYGYALRAYAYWGLDECGNALIDFATVTDLEPDYAYTYWAQAYCQLFLGNANSAETSATRALETATDPYDLGNAHLLSGWLAYRAGSFSAASDHFVEASGFAGADAEPLIGRWLAMARMGENGAGVFADASDEVLARNSFYQDVVGLLTGEFTPDAYLEMNNFGSAAYFYAAQYYLVMGEPGKAERALEQAAEGKWSTSIEVPLARQMLRDRDE